MDHTSDPNAMRHAVDPRRLDLVAAFRKNPLGVHGPELRALLAKMRWGRPQGRLVLIVLEPGRAWRLSRIPERRGDPMPYVDDRVFTSLAEAEWHVFKLRWQALTGEALPPEFQGDLQD